MPARVIRMVLALQLELLVVEQRSVPALRLPVPQLALRKAASAPRLALQLADLPVPQLVLRTVEIGWLKMIVLLEVGPAQELQAVGELPQPATPVRTLTVPIQPNPWRASHPDAFAGMLGRRSQPALHFRWRPKFRPDTDTLYWLLDKVKDYSENQFVPPQSSLWTRRPARPGAIAQNR